MIGIVCTEQRNVFDQTIDQQYWKCLQVGIVSISIQTNHFVWLNSTLFAWFRYIAGTRFLHVLLQIHIDYCVVRLIWRKNLPTWYQVIPSSYNFRIIKSNKICSKILPTCVHEHFQSKNHQDSKCSYRLVPWAILRCKKKHLKPSNSI